ncbi:MAG: hypothetical protein U1E53_17690 [Dongiaceae bacterium]
MKAYVEASGQLARVDALKEFASTAPLFGAPAEGLPNGVYQPGWPRDQSGFYEALGTQVSLVMTGQVGHRRAGSRPRKTAPPC